MSVIYLTICTVGALTGLLYVLQRLKSEGINAAATQPAVLAVTFLSLIHFVVPVIKFAAGHYNYQISYANDTLLWNVGLSYIALILVMAFLHGVKMKRRPAIPAMYGSGEAVQAIVAGVTLTSLGVWNISIIQGRLFSRGIEEFLNDRISSSSMVGFVIRFDFIAVVGLGFLMAGLLEMRPRKFARLLWLIWLGLTLYTLSYFSLIQSRNSVLLSVLLFIFILIYVRSVSFDASWSGIRSGVLVVVIGAVFMIFARESTHNRLRNANLSHGEIYLEALDGSFGNDENCLWLIEAEPSLLLGQTYIAGIFNLIPRAVWPGKPWGAGPELRNLIYPGSYILGAKGNTSFTTGLLPEARMNFGAFGFILVIAVWSMVVRWAVAIHQRTSGLCADVLMLLFLILFCGAVVYSEFLGLFGRMFVCFLAGVLGLLCSFAFSNILKPVWRSRIVSNPNGGGN